jgi:hypothetical protein
MLPPSAQLNPSYRYLRVQADEQPPALLVLGYINPHSQGDIEVWYSAKGEVIKLQRGRLVGTAGLKTDWLALRHGMAIPGWENIDQSGTTYERIRDERPGYKDGIVEKLHISMGGKQQLHLSGHQPEGLQRQQLRWFTETVIKPSANGLPPALFGWGQHRGVGAIVYSRQCLTETFCLTLQAWPPEGETP